MLKHLSCSHFKEFILKWNDLNQIQLRSDVPAPESCKLSDDTTTDESNLLTEYITPDSIVTVAADSIETVWLIKVIENECVSNGEDQDDYGHIIIKEKKGFVLHNNELGDIIHYIVQNTMGHL